MNARFPLRVAREHLASVSFSSSEVLTSPAAIHSRNRKLQRACRLGNSLRSKVRIQFQTEEGPREALGIIRTLTDRYIGLNSGGQIPICAIFHVAI